MEEQQAIQLCKEATRHSPMAESHKEKTAFTVRPSKIQIQHDNL